MRILVIADVHGDFKTLSKIIENVDKNFDVIIAPGDFSDMNTIPNGFKQEDIIEMIIQELLSLQKPLLCVPGNHDPYETIEIFKDYGVNLHGEVKKIGNYVFMGVGGAKTPFFTKFEPTEEEIEEELNSLYERVKEKFVLVTHAPPYNTKLDVIGNKNVGYRSIRKFIEEKKPMFVISAHIHENHGEDVIGNTKLFYPGPVYNGYYGFVNINNEITCNIMQLKSQILRKKNQS